MATLVGKSNTDLNNVAKSALSNLNNGSVAAGVSASAALDSSTTNNMSTAAITAKLKIRGTDCSKYSNSRNGNNSHARSRYGSLHRSTKCTNDVHHALGKMSKITSATKSKRDELLNVHVAGLVKDAVEKGMTSESLQGNLTSSLKPDISSLNTKTALDALNHILCDDILGGLGNMGITLDISLLGELLNGILCSKDTSDSTASILGLVSDLISDGDNELVTAAFSNMFKSDKTSVTQLQEFSGATAGASIHIKTAMVSTNTNMDDLIVLDKETKRSEDKDSTVTFLRSVNPDDTYKKGGKAAMYSKSAFSNTQPAAPGDTVPTSPMSDAQIIYLKSLRSVA